jgi:WD40 repeat protein
MPISRRHFALALASGTATGFVSALNPTYADELRVISWPSRVVPLPPDASDQKPPVVTAVRLHKAGQLLATAGDDHLVRVWNLADGKLVHRLDAHTDWVRTIDYSPDGRVLASAGSDRRIIFWEAASGLKRGVLATHQAAIAAIRFGHGGQLLAAAGFEGVVRLYDVPGQRLIAQPAAPCQDMRAVAFSPDDQLLAAGGRCGSIRLISALRGELIRDIPAHRQRIRTIAFSPDGGYLASSGEDRMIHISPLADGTRGYRLPPRPTKVLSLVFFGNQHLASAGSDNLIRLWDVAARKEIGILRGHTGSIAALECQEKVLISAGYDTTVRIWEVGDQVAGGAAERPARVGTRPIESVPRK